MSLRVIIGLIVILLLILLFFIVSRDESSAAKSRGVVKSNGQSTPSNYVHSHKSQTGVADVSLNDHPDSDNLSDQQILGQNKKTETATVASASDTAEYEPSETSDQPLFDEDELQQMLDDAGSEIEEDFFKQVNLVERQK